MQCRCILEIPDSVGSDRKHFDPEQAAGSTGADWLVQSLQPIIDAGFKMATGQASIPTPACHSLPTRTVMTSSTSALVASLCDSPL